ncbi:flagellar export protein FliJ [Nitrosococcus wardiae]|uniref:Flagellar FliJ protein n=1 Tax=Nitrosococcus wardiae TaxID=1814290 RepID=A0A4P7C1E0_9GAMM|nr:flagellar export protein FliJ [Nitrosococcus wardiae]QBQ54626.1 flagellar export protein FliJ [Nitrosococcus wardiae]
MTRSHRLYSLLRVAEAQEQQAARGLSEAQRLLQQQHHQLEEMHRYREEYTQYFQTVGRNGVGVQQLQQLQSFLTQLDRAIGQQKQRLQQYLQQLEQRRNGWLEARSHVKALGKLEERYRQEERCLAAHREQAEVDDRYQHWAEDSGKI